MFRIMWMTTQLQPRNPSLVFNFPTYQNRYITYLLVILAGSLVFPAISTNVSENEISLDSANEKSTNLPSCSISYNRSRIDFDPKLTAKCLLGAREMSGTQQVNEDLLPKWTNISLFAAGQAFARKNIGYLGVSHFFALIFENFIPDIKDVLITTGSSSTMDRAVKRYTATATQILLWYRNSLLNPVEKEVLLDSLRNVRRLHLDGAFKTILRWGNGKNKYLDTKQSEILKQLYAQRPPSIVFDDRFWSALEKDLSASNIPPEKRRFPEWKDKSGPTISQFAQSLTQFSFVGLPVLFHKELGISHVSNEELEGYIHMWAAIGHALGISDEFNICLHGGLHKSKPLFREIFEIYFIPAMFQFDWRVRVQLGAYLDALHHMDQVITPRLITYRFLRDFVKINPQNLLRQFSILERMYLALVDSLMSNNLDANRFLLNRGGLFFLDVNGYQSFGDHYRSDARKSRGAFYTREKVSFR